jgi:two-component system, response regulator
MFESKEILLVEDNASSRELIFHALQETHLANNVRMVPDGAEALDYVFRRGKHADRDPHNPPVLILLDLKLPHVGGLEILRELRAQECTRLIPVVVFSASENEQDILRSYEQGANGYVIKPVDYEQFTRVIHDLAIYWLSMNIPPSC